MLLRNWISLGPNRPVLTCRGVSVCSVNQWFPTEACLKLFKLSVRSLEANLKSADKLLTPPLPLIYASADASLTSCEQTSLSMLSCISMYRSIWSTTVPSHIWKALEHLLCLLPKHPAEACLICWVIMAVLILLYSQQHCRLIKNSFKFKVCPKPQATHFPEGIFSVWSLFFPYKCRQRCAHHSHAAVPDNKGTESCNVWVKHYLISYLCCVLA